MQIINKIKQKLIFLLKEWVKTFSNKASFFSSKRIERSIAFALGCIVLMSWFFVNILAMEVSAAIGVAVVFFGLAGYIMDKTQKEKKEDDK